MSEYLNNYLIAELDLSNVYARTEDLEEARQLREHFRKSTPDDQHPVIFKQTSPTTWEAQVKIEEFNIVL